MENLITRCLQINNDIYSEYKNSKYPKIISRIIYEIKKRKLIEIVTKIRKANVPLEIDDLLDLFFHILSNYPIDGCFGTIDRSYILETEFEKYLIVKLHTDSSNKKFGLIKAEFRFDLNIEKINNFTAEIFAESFDDSGNNFLATITLNKMFYKKDKTIKEFVSDLNDAIYFQIYSYIIGTINGKI